LNRSTNIMLKGKQKKLDANKDGEISGDDFKMLRSKKGMNEGGVMSDKEDSAFQKEMERKTSESKDRSNENMKFVRENISKLKGILSERELQSIQKMMENKPEMKSKGGSIFSRKNYKRTGKI
jgi:hypothetical protein